MALGNPVLRHIDRESPFGVDLPIVRTTASTLQDDLLALITTRSRLAEIGAASRSFVEREHDPRTVARSVLEGLVPLPSETDERQPERTGSAGLW
jgi:hypothetical protein